MSSLPMPVILHHGAVTGVTGSCHELKINDNNSVLIDCGLFQGAETSPGGSDFNKLEIDFPLDSVQALLITHCHIDHVGRIPYLLAAGFKGPIYCTEPTAELVPLVLEDAVKIGFTRDKALIRKFINLLKSRIYPVPYCQWQSVPLLENSDKKLKIKFKPAGHILGSAYIECDVSRGAYHKRIVFSGDLGGPYTPLLPAPKSPYKADVLVLESTYGDKQHDKRQERKTLLKKLIKRCLLNKGVILIPAFSIGRTQELLYELEDIIFSNKNKPLTSGLNWDDLDIIVDSPLANNFTDAYKKLRPYWDAEARGKIRAGRHPLSFQKLVTINSHGEHLNTLDTLQKSARSCVVLAASGMCSGGRIVNYLKKLIEDKRTDIVFVGYQARGTTGRIIQQYGKKHGYVEIERHRYAINAGVYTLSGYSAHADQRSLLHFVQGMRQKPEEIRLVHGDEQTKKIFQSVLNERFPQINIIIPQA